MSENKSIEIDSNDILDNCPLCGFRGIEEGTCLRCGLVFSKYYKVQARKREMGQLRREQSLAVIHGKKHKSITGIITVLVSIVAFFFFGAVIGTNSLANENRSTSNSLHIISYKENLHNEREKEKPIFKKGFD